MEVLRALFDSLQEDRNKQVAALDEAKKSLHEELRVLKLQDILVATRLDCGSDVTYQYPDPDELGISLEDLDSDNAGVQARVDSNVESANEDSRKRKGHIGLLLTTFGLDAEAIDIHRCKARESGRAIVKAMLRIQQIDDLILPLLSVPAGAEMSPTEIAQMFCGIGEDTPVTARQP
jgi:hypothetical protein